MRVNHVRVASAYYFLLREEEGAIRHTINHRKNIIFQKFFRYRCQAFLLCWRGGNQGGGSGNASDVH